MDLDEDQYTRRFLEAIDERIYVAGVRLAAMLNQMVLKEQPASARVQFVKAIEAITGALSDFISLQPRASNPGDQEVIDDGNHFKPRK